jgi:hypothetical protein
MYKTGRKIAIRGKSDNIIHFFIHNKHLGTRQFRRSRAIFVPKSGSVSASTIFFGGINAASGQVKPGGTGL